MSLVKRVYNLKIERLPGHKLKLKKLPIPKILPPKIDLSISMPPVYDQGNLGSCTAQALCALVSFCKPSYNGSRLFLYYCERNIENTISFDSGSTLFDGIKSLQKFGICPEADWPYIISKYKIAPPRICYQKALDEQALIVENINSSSVEAMKNCLAQGFPFVIGFLVFPSFETIKVAKTGLVPLPSRQERPLGGHAVSIVGYNDSLNCFYARNSWGTNWGIKGYFYIPYAYLSNPKLASDAWTIKLME